MGARIFPSSRDRVAGFTKKLHEEFGVEIVGSIDDLLSKVDVVLLESVDGRPHLEQARPVFKARKPVFIDKPVAGSLADAIAIFDLARESGTPCFSSSSLRFSPGIAAMRHDPKVGDVLGCDTFGPARWKSITLICSGTASTASRPSTPSWARAASRFAHPDREYRPGRRSLERTAGSVRSAACARALTSMVGPSSAPRGMRPLGDYGGYEPLVVEIVKFFKTGTPPVAADETIEIFAFMEAADESKRQGGKPVTIESVMAKARSQLGK